ncbi:MAG: T9SS type A sorting domain-containing protein [Ignavibacteriaceae bacterium]
MGNIFKKFIKSCPKTGKFTGFKPLKGFSNLLWPVIGFLALLWIIIRVIPKPNRLQYPCMKVAAPFAANFVLYVSGLIVTVFSVKKAGHYFSKSKYAIAALLIFAGLFTASVTILKTNNDTYATIILTDSLFVPSDPLNNPIGTAKGIFPGRVVWMWDSSATSWNGKSGYWWDDKNTNQEVVDSMLSKSLRALTGKSSDIEAWDALFKYFNNQHGKGSTGYQKGEKIAVKINLNQISGSWNPGNASFPSPQVVLALLKQLVIKAGVAAKDITFYDTNRYVPDAIYTRCKKEFPEVHFMGWSEMNGREKYIRDTTTIHWSEHLTKEIGGGNPAYLPSVVTQAAYIISMPDFKGHRYVGVTFCSKNHFGTFSCDDSTGSPYIYAPHAAGLHPYVAVHDIIIEGSPEWTFYGRPMRTYNALVDLMGHKDIGGKTLLFMIDALYGVKDEQSPVALESKWLSVPFNNDWTSSLFLSQDNTAIESVGLDFFRSEQGVNSNYYTVYGAVDNYLHEAALADSAPSGTVYDPEGDGIPLTSLGVHEHWDDPADKEYSRNLKTGDGIELIGLNNALTSVKDIKNPSAFFLYQNYPNPFNPSTTIKFDLQKADNISLNIFDITGRLVDVIINDEIRHSGSYEVKYNAGDLASGVYFIVLKTNNYTSSKKIVLLK